MVLIRGNKQLAWDVNYSSYFLVCWAKPRFKLAFNSVAKIFATHTANNFLKTLFTCQYFCFEAEMILFGELFCEVGPQGFFEAPEHGCFQTTVIARMESVWERPRKARSSGED